MEEPDIIYMCAENGMNQLYPFYCEIGQHKYKLLQGITTGSDHYLLALRKLKTNKNAILST